MMIKWCPNRLRHTRKGLPRCRRYTLIASNRPSRQTRTPRAIRSKGITGVTTRTRRAWTFSPGLRHGEDPPSPRSGTYPWVERTRKVSHSSSSSSRPHACHRLIRLSTRDKEVGTRVRSRAPTRLTSLISINRQRCLRQSSDPSRRFRCNSSNTRISTWEYRAGRLDMERGTARIISCRTLNRRYTLDRAEEPGIIRQDMQLNTFHRSYHPHHLHLIPRLRTSACQELDRFIPRRMVQQVPQVRLVSREAGRTRLGSMRWSTRLDMPTPTRHRDRTEG